MFISLEGVDGSGKSSLAATLESYINLHHPNRNVIKVKAPGQTKVGRKIRELLLSDSTAFTSETELLLFTADLNELCRQIIKPALANPDNIVICDRFVHSAIVYQGYGRGVDKEWVLEVLECVSKQVKPNLTIFLDLDVEESQRRINKRGTGTDRIESASLEFWAKVRQGFKDLHRYNQDTSILIDASQDIDTVSNLAITAIDKLLR